MKSKQLLRARKRLFYSAEQAAIDISNTSTKIWNEYESGKREIHDDVVEKIIELSNLQQEMLNSFIKIIEVKIASDGIACIPEKAKHAHDCKVSKIALYNIHSSVLATLEAMYGDKVLVV